MSDPTTLLECCTTCDTDLDPENSVHAVLAQQTPVAFCPECYSALTDMVMVHQGIMPAW